MIIAAVLLGNWHGCNVTRESIEKEIVYTNDNWCSPY